MHRSYLYYNIFLQVWADAYRTVIIYFFSVSYHDCIGILNLAALCQVGNHSSTNIMNANVRRYVVREQKNPDKKDRTEKL